MYLWKTPGLETWHICHPFRNLQSKWQLLTERMHLLSCRTLVTEVVSETKWCSCYQKLKGEKSDCQSLVNIFWASDRYTSSCAKVQFLCSFTDLMKAKCASLTCKALWGLSHMVSDAFEIAVGCDARIKFERTLFHFFVRLMCISHFQCIMQKIVW